MDGEGQSCEGERGSWRTTQSQNRVEQLTGLLPIGLGPEKDSVLTLGSKVSSWKEESQHGHHWWGGPRRWYEKVLGAPDPQLACPLPPPIVEPCQLLQVQQLSQLACLSHLLWQGEGSQGLILDSPATLHPSHRVYPSNPPGIWANQVLSRWFPYKRPEVRSSASQSRLAGPPRSSHPEHSLRLSFSGLPRPSVFHFLTDSFSLSLCVSLCLCVSSQLPSVSLSL